jgi:hypothetical protein
MRSRTRRLNDLSLIIARSFVMPRPRDSRSLGHGPKGCCQATRGLGPLCLADVGGVSAGTEVGRGTRHGRKIPRLRSCRNGIRLSPGLLVWACHRSVHEALPLIAMGQIVHPTVRSGSALLVGRPVSPTQSRPNDASGWRRGSSSRWVSSHSWPPPSGRLGLGRPDQPQLIGGVDHPARGFQGFPRREQPASGRTVRPGGSGWRRTRCRH